MHASGWASVVAGEEIHGRDACFAQFTRNRRRRPRFKTSCIAPDEGAAADGLGRGSERFTANLCEKCGVGIDESPIHSLSFLRDASLPPLAEWSCVKCLTAVVRGILRGCFPYRRSSPEVGASGVFCLRQCATGMYSASAGRAISATTIDHDL